MSVSISDAMATLILIVGVFNHNMNVLHRNTQRARHLSIVSTTHTLCVRVCVCVWCMSTTLYHSHADLCLLSPLSHPSRSIGSDCSSALTQAGECTVTTPLARVGATSATYRPLAALATMKSRTAPFLPARASRNHPTRSAAVPPDTSSSGCGSSPKSPGEIL